MVCRLYEDKNEGCQELKYIIGCDRINSAANNIYEIQRQSDSLYIKDKEADMKHSKKLSVIRECMNNQFLCRCYFKYDENYRYYYINDVNDEFVLGQEENDFLLDGYTINKLSHLSKAEIKDDACNEINRLNGIISRIKNPEIDISSWQGIFQSLKNLDKWIIVSNEYDNNGFFYIGTIIKAGKNKLTIKPFDADGIWLEEMKIPYEDITSVSFDTRYINNWRMYLERTKEG